jgi:DNA-binding transcriptional LysR family regulator
LRVEIVDLETFIAVAALGSFSAAARQLNLTQPSVSGRIQRLEAALGAKLLVRTTRKVELTRRGALLQGEADRTLAGLRGLVDRFRRDAAASRSRVVVAATQMVAATMLPDVLRSHRERYPAVDVQLRDLRHADALQAIVAGDADVAVIHFDGTDKRFRSQPLRDEPIVLVVPPNHPLAKAKRATLDEMAAFPLMMLEQYEGMKTRIAAEVARHGLTLQARRRHGRPSPAARDGATEPSGRAGHGRDRGRRLPADLLAGDAPRLQAESGGAAVLPAPEGGTGGPSIGTAYQSICNGDLFPAVRAF